MNICKKHRLLSASFIALLVASSGYASTHLKNDDDVDLLTIAPCKKSGVIEKSAQIEDVKTSLNHHSDEDVSIAGIAIFPPEMLSYVFSFLDAVDIVSAAQVCRYGRDVAQEHHHFMPRTINDYVTFRDLYGPDLELGDRQTREKAIAARALITHLEITDKDHKIGRVDLARILDLTPRLRSIKIMNAELMAPNLPLDASTSLRATPLESLELSHCTIKQHTAQTSITDALRATGAYVAALMVDNAKHFRNLKIEGIPGFFTNHVLPSFKENKLLKDIKGRETNPFKAFKRLEILGDGYMTELPSEFSLFEQLKILRLSSANVQTVAQAKGGFEYFPKLEVLEINNNQPQERQQGIANLLKAAGHAKTLKTLTLDNVGVTKFNEGNNDLLAPFKDLENFHSMGNTALAVLPKTLYESKTLKHLVITDSALGKFDRNFESPLIRHVDFSNNPALDASPSFEHPDGIEFLNLEGMPVQSKGWSAFFTQQWNTLCTMITA
jgi:hypothetical protein